MTFTVESKSQLAKLMATENITVQHAKVQTAYFDLKNRTLVCPIWKDMGGDTYDLLLGHEVGHATETPTQGWHDAVCEKGKGYKHFLNVIEDARIEKKIKRRYPGLKKSFKTAYEKFNDQDFFGIKGRDVSELYFIDRLNLHFKSLFTTAGLDFTPEEQNLVDEVYACESWEDVVAVTDKVWSYSKQEQKEKNEQEELKALREDFENGDGDYDDESEDGEGDSGEDSETDTTGQGDEDGEESEDGKPKNVKDGDGDEDDIDGETSSLPNRFKESYNNEDYSPVSETDESFRQREAELLSKESKSYAYLNVPKPILNNIITPAAKVHSMIYNHVTDKFGKEILTSNDSLIEFKKKNERYISLLSKEFEMRKAAKSFAKTKISTGGDLDMGKIYKYQLDDSIFRKLTKTPKGKSHGLVILLDKSGSMSNNMAGSIEQVLILTYFCRKVNIPFVVYGFGDSIGAKQVETGELGYVDVPLCFENNEKDLMLDYVFLREYLNSRMSGSEFTQAVKNLLYIKKLYEYDSNQYALRGGLPTSESLSATPFNETVFAVKPIVDSFRKNNNLDLVNIVFIQDGDADTTNRFVKKDVASGYNYFSTSRENVVLVDNKTKKNYPVTCDNYGVTSAAIQWLTESTGAKVFGFFITEKGNSARNALFRHFRFEDDSTLVDKIHESVIEEHKKMGIIRSHVYDSEYRKSEILKSKMEILKHEKFLESYKRGYRKFYFVVGGDSLQVDNEEIEISGNVTAGKLKNAFGKYNKKRQVNRVLVSRFVQEIAV